MDLNGSFDSRNRQKLLGAIVDTLDTTNDFGCDHRIGYRPIQLINSPLTLIGAGHQRTVSTSTGCNQWLSLAKTLLKVALLVEIFR